VPVIFRGLHLFCFATILSGCADILPWPGFESKPAIFSYAEQIPATEVAEQVRCELAQFVAHDAKSKMPLLDSNGGAQVQLKLTTDLQGSVQWLGINLKGLGLGALAELVSRTNNVPSLQLKAQGKTTTVSQIDFVIPQTSNPDIQVAGQRGPTHLPPNLQLQPGGCSPSSLATNLKYGWFNLWLDDALKRYTNRIYKRDNYWPSAGNLQNLMFYDLVCQPKLTISTQFQLLFDVSAGTNIFNASPIILPISGLTIDGSPDYTHYLQIAFTLKQADSASIKACKALQPQNAPPHAGGTT
jgi:hypothetical protein